MKEGPITQFSHYSLALLRETTASTVEKIREGSLNLIPASHVSQLLEEWQHRLDTAVSSMQDTLTQDFR